MEILPFLKLMISAPGLSGYEAPVRGIIEAAWKPFTDELSVSRLGSLHGLQRGTGTEPRPGILLAAHMDAVGLMVTRVEDGFLHFNDVGGVDPRILPGQPVTVHGREDLPALVVQPSPRLLPAKYQENPVGMEYLLIDTGLEAEEVSRLVRVGDRVSYAQAPLETGGETLVGHTLDDRAAVAALTCCLEELKQRPHTWDVWAVATVQEEETAGGGFTSTFQIKPSLAVAIDVTFAASPGSPEHLTYPLGEGLTLGWGANIHPALFKTFKELAERLEIPHAIELVPAQSGTDAYAMQVVEQGIPCMVVGIPLRYMHTPVEMVALKDIRRVGRLLAEFCAGLDAESMQKIAWEE